MEKAKKSPSSFSVKCEVEKVFWLYRYDIVFAGTPPMGMPGMMPDNKGRAGSFGPGGMMADNKPRAGSFGQTQVPQQPTTGFSIPHNSKLKHTQTFNMHDRNKRGYLTGLYQ